MKGRNTARPEPADGSSSPSAKDAAVRIVSLELGGAGGERIRVRLSDGSFFIVHAETAAREGIRADAELDAEKIASLESASEILFARSSALSYLSRSPHTRKGLSLKLRKKGYGAAAVRLAVERMAELGYLDDASFAALMVRARLDAGREGRKAVLRDLLRRGVPRPLADAAVEDGYPEEAELDKARELVRGLPARKAAARLQARGFRSRTIGRILRELGGPGTEEAGE